MVKVTLQLVSWNGAKYIPHLFRSLREQTMQDWDIIVIDNGSVDGTVASLSHELKILSQFRTKLRKELRCAFIRNAENRGFAGGHNQAFEATSDKRQATSPPEYVQLLNQDVVLAPDYLERLVAFLDTRADVAAVQGALLRWDFARDTRTDVIDTFGLRVLRSRRVVELFAGETRFSIPQCSSAAPVEVFGVSGALPLYRREALDAVSIDGDVFDRAFFSYKEDVDLAFRLRSNGWRAFVLPETCAWHDRSVATHRVRADRSPFERRSSYRNHLLTLMKNERMENLLRDLPTIGWYELQKLGYLIVRERTTLGALRDLWRQRERIRKARTVLQAQQRVEASALRRWFV